MRRAALVFLPAMLWAAGTPEEPVGLILNPAGAKLFRADAETPLAARSGDLLFAGDGIKTEAAAAQFLFCPAKQIQTLSAAGEVRFAATKPTVKAGTITPAPAQACTLPKTLRVAAASQQHYGVTMTRSGALDFKPVPQDLLPAEVRALAAPLEAALATTPNDPGALVSLATLYEEKMLPANALDAYTKLRAVYPDAPWLATKIFETGQQAAAQTAAAAAAGPGGTTYALLVGVSKYKKPEISLQFAHADASLFGDLLQSPRAGGVPKENILLLTDETATLAAVRNGFQDFLKRRAKKTDTVIILIAGHGTVETPGSKEAFILPYDADPQDLSSTALPMAELQSLFEEQLQQVGRVLLFVDVCKAGTIGTISNNTVSSSVQTLGDAPGDLFGLLASRPREVSFEGPEFGGGHGAFSYFVLKGLQGDADTDKDNLVNATELIDYVSDQVAEATKNKQHPREFGAYENTMRMADTAKPGIQIARNELRDPRTGAPIYLSQGAAPQALTPQATAALDRFDQAVAANPNGAFAALQALQGQLSPEQYQLAENRLRVALEDAAQAVLLQYLQGDQVPQTRDDFARAAQYMESARRLTAESLLLEARANFFNGRALLFDKQYANAAPLLEQAVRLDPGAAYTYNALGIAYLEQARFDEAVPAFRDAANRAQHWSYPLHNLALAYVETGDYDGAIKAYQKAISLTPEYAYLPYNLGLVYQRLNRRKDAEKSYRQAMSLNPAAAEPYNALGTLAADQGKDSDAEQFYRDSLQRNPDLLPARHNLGVLLASNPARRSEAIALFRDNLQRDPMFTASRLSLAETLDTSGDLPGAIAEYRMVLTAAPNFIGSRLALARLMLRTGDGSGAAEQARAVLAVVPDSYQAFELLGEALAAAGQTADARAAFQSAIDLKPARGDRKRLEGKRNALP